MAFGGTFTFDIPTYRAVLLAFLKSLERHGFKRVFIVNGHGGNIAALNAFLPDFARETEPEGPRGHLFRAGGVGPRAGAGGSEEGASRLRGGNLADDGARPRHR